MASLGPRGLIGRIYVGDHWPLAQVSSKKALRVLMGIQSTLVISNSKGPSETLRDIRTSTYQIFRIEEKIIWTTTFNKFMCNWTLDVRDISKILWKEEKLLLSSLGAISPLFHNIFYLLSDFHVSAGTRFSLRDKRLFEISEFEITRVKCSCVQGSCRKFCH